MRSEPRLIVMTGGTSGLGLHAARRIVAACGTLVLATRHAPAVPGAVAVPADLASLDTVRAFAARVRDFAGEGGIDALVLNAGGSFPSGALSRDGHDLTFAVNHLAHYLLVRLLLPSLANRARVVITTSGAHDSSRSTMLPPPRHADAFRLARPGDDPGRERDPVLAAGHAYAASKLCNILTARALAATPQAREKRLAVFSYSPGPTPGTGVVRDRSVGLNVLWRLVGPAIRPLMPRFHTPRLAGDVLADLALGRLAVPAGRDYALLERGELTFPDPSRLAQDAEAMERLWADSATLIGWREEELA